MNIENTNIETPISNEPAEQTLDAFESEFFGTGKAPEEKPVEPEVVVTDDGNEETVEVEDTNTEQLEDDDNEENDDTPAKQETRAEKRIRELNAKYREEERKRIELEERIAKLETPSTETPTDKKTPTEPNSDDGPKAPHWDDEDASGNKKYPLGQFDPQFNADLVRFTVQEEQRQYETRQEQLREQARLNEAQQAAQAEWQEKLTPVLERYPDYVDKGQELIDQFSDIEPAYGKYLTDTIQAIDNGPDVFYHLASNPDLAKAIVARGPAAATVELGRLSAILGSDEKAPKTPTPTKVTNASPPPPKVKGSAAPRLKNIDDNLDDFESVFFKK